MSSNKRTIEKNTIKQDGKVRYFQPIIGKSWCYNTMKSSKDRTDLEQHNWGVRRVDVR